MDYLELIRMSDRKVLFTFTDYMQARTTLFIMGFSDSVHKVDGYQRWQYKSIYGYQYYGLSHFRNGVQL